jgi:hypothetical protein
MPNRKEKELGRDKIVVGLMKHPWARMYISGEFKYDDPEVDPNPGS